LQIQIFKEKSSSSTGLCGVYNDVATLKHVPSVMQWFTRNEVKVIRVCCYQTTHDYRVRRAHSEQQTTTETLRERDIMQ